MSPHLPPLLIQFAKSPTANQVKTRLSPLLNQDQRKKLHCAMTAWVCENLYQFNTNVQLWISGEEQDLFIHKLRDRFKLDVYQQQGEDLGERMAFALSQGLLSHSSVIIVGSDCPFIDEHYLAAAVTQLQDHDIVIGPASDGGYVLIGARSFNAIMFKNIPWGSERVLSATLAALKQQKLSVSLLPELNDIDRPEDLLFLKNEHFPESLRLFSEAGN